MTDIDDPIEKMIPQVDDSFNSKLSVINNASTSEKKNNSENESQ